MKPRIWDDSRKRLRGGPHFAGQERVVVEGEDGGRGVKPRIWDDPCFGCGHVRACHDVRGEAREDCHALCGSLRDDDLPCSRFWLRSSRPGSPSPAGRP